MSIQKKYDFDRIAQAIEYIRNNFKSQPSLDDIANEVCLSPAHFHRIFSEWAGVSPKKFLQYISIEYAKQTLKGKTLSDVAYEMGLSGTGRLHDLFIKIEGMTPGEYKNGGENLSINYSYAESPFGEVVVASTPKGVCHMAFIDGRAKAFEILKNKYPKAKYSQLADAIQLNALSIFNQDWSKLDEIKLHLKGTDFQLKVWEVLLEIPVAELSTYGDIASRLGYPNASRAIGTAVGSNPVAMLIPCHRVIRASGELGGYHWGVSRKAAMIGWEAVRKKS